MTPVTPTFAVSKQALWAGRILSALPALLLFSTGLYGLIKPAAVAPMFVKLGYPENTLTPIVIAELVCAAIYAIPRTSVLGAILMTAYLGGATATHVRAGEPFYLPILIGVLVWGGLYLRDARLRALIPLRP